MKQQPINSEQNFKKKIVLSAEKDQFWLDIFDELHGYDYQVAYWVGANTVNVEPENCFFHEVVDAYMLENLYRAKLNKVFDIRSLSVDEYYNYIKILDRADNIGGYSFGQRDRLFKEQLNYWYSVLSEIMPELIVFSNLPHLLYDYPMYLMAKHLGIKTLIFNVTPFKGWHFVTDSLFSGGSCNLVKHAEKGLYNDRFTQVAISPYLNQSYTVPSYMQKQIDFDKKNSRAHRLINFVLIKLGILKKPSLLMRTSWRKDIFDFFGVQRKCFGTKILYFFLLDFFKNELLRRYNKAAIDLKTLENIECFVYVPLHYQPEATTAPLGSVFSDQIYMLEILRATLPSHVSLVVKEHYSQFSGALSGFRGRYLNYYDKIASMDNVYIAPLDFDPKSLIIKSLAVATVTGTAGWEAIQYGKHCVVFGEPWYKSHPNLICYDDNFKDNVSKILAGESCVNMNAQFLDDFCQSLICVDIHNYSDGEVSREPKTIVDIIAKFISK